MDSLVINQIEIFHSLAGTLKCKFLTKPHWLKYRNGPLYHTAASSQKNRYHYQDKNSGEISVED